MYNFYINRKKLEIKHIRNLTCHDTLKKCQIVLIFSLKIG